MKTAARALPASLQAATAADTPYGGVDVTWTEVATLWVSLGLAAPAQQFDGAVSSPADTDTANGIANDHPVAAPGQRLLVGDDPEPWRVRRVDRGAPSLGRMTLRLDRLT